MGEVIELPRRRVAPKHVRSGAKVNVATLLGDRAQGVRILAQTMRSPTLGQAIGALASAPKLVELRRCQAAAGAAFDRLVKPLAG